MEILMNCFLSLFLAVVGSLVVILGGIIGVVLLGNYLEERFNWEFAIPVVAIVFILLLIATICYLNCYTEILNDPISS
jgi:hypothetical protein